MLTRASAKSSKVRVLLASAALIAHKVTVGEVRSLLVLSGCTIDMGLNRRVVNEMNHVFRQNARRENGSD